MKAKLLHSNGNGHGHGSLTRRKLEQLLVFHQTAAEGLRTTLALIDNAAFAMKAVRGPSVVEAAIELDNQRRHRKKAARRANRGAAKLERTARRERTRKFLDSFDATKPSRGDASLLENLARGGVGTLMRHGYLRKKGKGYVRTAKEFTA